MFFFGANVALPQAKELSSAINKASTAIEQFASSQCQLVKTLLKFNTDNYISAGNAMTDVEFMIQDLQAFYSSFLTCLNNQNESSTTAASMQNIANLIYQLDTYVFTGLTKLTASATVLGAVFGEKVPPVITALSEQFTKELEIVKKSLETLMANFKAIIEAGNDITVESLAVDISTTAITDMITAFKDITVSSQQMSFIINGFIKITTILDTVQSSVEVVKTNSTGTIKKAEYELEIISQASKTAFTKNILTQITSVSDAFAEFNLLASNLFTGDADATEFRGIVDSFVIEIKAVFEKASDSFTTIINASLKTMEEQIITLRKTVEESTTLVKSFLAEAVLMSSGNFIKCLGPDSNNSVVALQLIQALGMNSSSCITVQQNVSMKAQSLMTFIVEDVVLNVGGAADKLCGCSVGGGKKNVDKSKTCIKKVNFIELISC